MKIKWFFTGQDVPSKVAEVTSWPIANYVIALLALLIALVSGMLMNDIKNATTLFFSFIKLGLVGCPDLSVVLFYVFVGLWSCLFYLKQVGDSAQKEGLGREVAKAHAAIYRAPNPRVFIRYPQRFELCAEALEKFDFANFNVNSSNLQNKDQLLDMSLTIRTALVFILHLVGEFRNKIPNRISVNVMLPHYGSENEVKEALGESLRFRAIALNWTAYECVLYISDALMLDFLSEKSDIEDRVVDFKPVFALPVLKLSEVKDNPEYLLPGASSAFVTGKMSVYDKTSEIGRDCRGPNALVKEEVQKYFAEEGGDINSFLSIRIGNKSDPVGVLNIDCNEEHLLGENPEYYGTLQALITPFLKELVLPLQRYNELSES